MSAWWRTLDFSELLRLSQASRDARALSERCSPELWLLLRDTDTSSDTPAGGGWQLLPTQCCPFT